jgi:hypothetical protein
MDQRKLVTFLGRRPTVLMLCLDITLLMQLQVDPMKSRKATNFSHPPFQGTAIYRRMDGSLRYCTYRKHNHANL